MDKMTEFLFSLEFWKIFLGPIITFFIGAATVKSNRNSNKRNNEILKDLKEKELNANIISNARIKWLETVRLHSAEFIKNYVAIISNEHLTRTGKKQENYEEFIKYYYLLKLYYTEKNRRGRNNRKHEEITSILDDLYSELLVEIIWVTEHQGEFDHDRLEKMLHEFTTISSNYFKIVWEEAKDIENAR